MPVDWIHAVIGLLFVTLWAVMSQFTFGGEQRHTQRPGSSGSSSPPHHLR